MSKNEIRTIKIVEEVFEKKLKEVLAVFKANQPSETSKVVSLVQETIKKELEPIKSHLSEQDKKLAELLPVYEGLSFAKIGIKFLIWIAPAGGILIAFFKWLK